MFEKDEFENWIKASHILFEIFEGRYDAYPLSVVWIKEWLNSNTFTVTKDHANRISALIEDFSYEIFNVKGELKERIDAQLKNLLKDQLKEGKSEYIGFALAPYLFTWNFHRFKEYFKQKEDFSLNQYFQTLSGFLKDQRKDIEIFTNKRLLQEQIDTEKVGQFFHKVNTELGRLGIGHNEPVGTIKLIHAFAPHYFPLIDSNMADTMGLLRSNWESLTFDSYLKWMKGMRNWLLNYAELIEKIEREYASSILKLVDEGLYMMITVKQRRRVADLGINLEG